MSMVLCSSKELLTSFDKNIVPTSVSFCRDIAMIAQKARKAIFTWYCVTSWLQNQMSVNV